jgi:hypothetical protein
MLEETDRPEGNRPTLFHIVQMKRQTARNIQSVQDEQRHTQWSPKGFVHTFTTYLQRKYETIVVDEECVASIAEAHPATYKELLEQPIAREEISNALRKGRKRQEVMVLDWNYTRRT